MSGIQKGTITTIEGDKARVQSILKEGDVTKPLKIADGIDTTALKKGTEVAYTVFDDMTGLIIAKM